MAHVIVLDSINDDLFVCGVCKSVFNSLEVFLSHKRLRCSDTVLEGNILASTEVRTTVAVDTSCSPIITSKQEHTHLSDHDNANEIQQVLTTGLNCVVCKKRFKKTKSMLAHMKSHKEKPYQCPICGRCFIQNSHLQRHIITHKIWPDAMNQTTAKSIEAGVLSYSCSYCNVVINNYSQYKVHMKSHLSFKMFKCVQGGCMEFFDTLDSLMNHVTTSHETQTYSCHLCRSHFSSLEHIAAHQLTHKNVTREEITKQTRLYKCTQCDAEFRNPDKLSLHMLTENHKRVCIHCSKTFASEKRLRLHLQIHQKFKPFRCNICNVSFHMKKYLTSHMLKHSIKQYKCPVCKYMFRRSDILYRHMKVHQPKKSFKCPFQDSLNCKREFSRSDKLKLHMKCHIKQMSLNAFNEAK